MIILYDDGDKMMKTCTFFCTFLARRTEMTISIQKFNWIFKEPVVAAMILTVSIIGCSGILDSQLAGIHHGGTKRSPQVHRVCFDSCVSSFVSSFVSSLVCTPAAHFWHLFMPASMPLFGRHTHTTHTWFQLGCEEGTLALVRMVT